MPQQGLSVSRVVNVDVSFAPTAAPYLDFDTLLIMGDSDVVDTGEMLRKYNSLTGVTVDFGTTTPEYLAADLYFSQSPQPDTLYIGRWAATATHGVLVGGALSAQQQLLSNWTSITNGGFSVTVDGGTIQHLTGLNFSAISNLNGVASAINAVLTGAVASWDGTRFRIKSSTTGATSSVTALTAPTAGTDISAQLQMTATTMARDVNGIVAETPVAGVTRVDGQGWYGLMFSSTTVITDSQNTAVAAYIQAAQDNHIFGISTASAAVPDPTQTSDLASVLSLADYTRTFMQYSLSSPYAVASWFGRAFSVDFEGSNTTITMKFKSEPGVTPEILSATAASTLAAKRCNVYALYNNGASITQEGVMCGTAYFDEMHGLDWLANRIQVDLFNAFRLNPKIPQTDPGVQVLVTLTNKACAQGVTNGLSAPGVWNAAGFGSIQTGGYLAKGYYTYAASVDTQSQVDRDNRVASMLQVALKLAGALHNADVLINVNR